MKTFSLYCLFTHMSNARLDEFRQYLYNYNCKALLISTSVINSITGNFFYGKSLVINGFFDHFCLTKYNTLLQDYPELKPLFFVVNSLMFTPSSFFQYISTKFSYFNFISFFSIHLNIVRLVFRYLRSKYIYTHFLATTSLNYHSLNLYSY